MVNAQLMETVHVSCERIHVQRFTRDCISFNFRHFRRMATIYYIWFILTLYSMRCFSTIRKALVLCYDMYITSNLFEITWNMTQCCSKMRQSTAKISNNRASEFYFCIVLLYPIQHCELDLSFLLGYCSCSLMWKPSCKDS